MLLQHSGLVEQLLVLTVQVPIGEFLYAVSQVTTYNASDVNVNMNMDTHMYMNAVMISWVT